MSTDSPRASRTGTATRPRRRRSRPDSLKEAGLSHGFICDMLLRTLYTRGAMIGRDLAQFLCLPFKVIREPLKFLKDEKCIQVDGGDLVGEVSYKFSLTDLGRKRAQDAMEQCAYVGPAPVPLEDYVEQCYRQTVTGLALLPRGAARRRSATWCSKRRCSTTSARRSSAAESVFIYGPPGQRQDGDGPRHRRLHEHRRRRRSTSRTRSSPTATSSPSTTRRCTSIDDTPTEYVDEADATVRKLLYDRRDGPALGAHPPAGDRDRRRAEPRRCSTCGTTRRRTSTRPRSTSRPTAACS